MLNKVWNLTPTVKKRVKRRHMTLKIPVLISNFKQIKRAFVTCPAENGFSHIKNPHTIRSFTLEASYVSMPVKRSYNISSV